MNRTNISDKAKAAMKAIAEIESVDDLRPLWDAIKRQQRALAVRVAQTFTIGEEVEFDARTRGIKRGHIVEFNPKTIVVDVGGVQWKVGATLLKRVERAQLQALSPRAS